MSCLLFLLLFCFLISFIGGGGGGGRFVFTFYALFRKDAIYVQVVFKTSFFFKYQLDIVWVFVN